MVIEYIGVPEGTKINIWRRQWEIRKTLDGKPSKTDRDTVKERLNNALWEKKKITVSRVEGGKRKDLYTMDAIGGLKGMDVASAWSEYDDYYSYVDNEDDEYDEGYKAGYEA
eukprot:176866_1